VNDQGVLQRTAQHRASDPAASAWVDASAGTGKTKVLTDRVLRLLLDGTEPQKILCITFTRAAAAEMSNRIVEALGEWAVMPDAELDRSLTELTGARPNDRIRSRARQLFARIVDAQPALRIQTIHAFCQSVLRRFPVEAGLAPHFELIDDRTGGEMLAEAQRDLLVEAGLRPGEPLGRALAVLVEHMNEQRFGELMQTVVAARREIADALEAHHGAALLIAAMRRKLELAPDESPESILAAACRGGIDTEGLRLACARLSEGSDTDRRRGRAIAAWLESADRAAGWDGHIAAFLTEKGEPNRSFARTKAHQEMAPILDAEADRVARICERLRAAKTARATEALLVAADALLSRYEAAKRARALLDYDDLVEKSRQLLESPERAAWVLFKLDGGIDHLLLDEAQDTNPEQWRIVQALAEEFFSGEGARDRGRTIFVVGDEKQSIYSFQGADPTGLGRLKRHFEQRIRDAEAKFEPVDLTVSYRSTEPILTLVDQVFSDPIARHGVVSDPDTEIRHRARRVGHGGLVELWAPFTPTESQEILEPWPAPSAAPLLGDPQTELAEHIAETIKDWIARSEMLPGQGRAIAAGDVMILVRRRTRFVDPMVRALKTRGVPVAGVDRLALTGPLAVRDLMALGRFLLLPEDDLNLAALLKSPLIGLAEDELFLLAHGRAGSLWRALSAAAERDLLFEPVRAWLEGLLATVDFTRPFELFARVLAASCPGDPSGSGRRALWRRLGPDAIDPLDEFLSAALEFERRHPPTLEGFIGWLETSETEVKRELANRGDAVRIVTVHGAKGLQAPVVFLPDTIQLPRPSNGPQLLWAEESDGRRIPYWVPRADIRPAFCARLAEAARIKTDQEYRRLLYVALTRAQDRLYVAGWTGPRSPTAGHWHGLVEAGMRAAGAIEIENGERRILRIEQPQTRPVPRAVSASRPLAAPALPDWARRPAPKEPRPTRPLTPSRLETPGADEPAAPSPASAEDARRFRRGRAMHRLLQILPDLAADERAAGGARLLAEFAPEEQETMLAEALTVIEDPACAAFFGPSSRAEVPIVGRIGVRGISGQIDRLLVEPARVTIIDFKSGRAPPAGSKNVPTAYLAQMAAYRAVLRQIYPDRDIALVLVWTEGPRVDRIPADALDPFEDYLRAAPA
jgi:ATP-dependent helicase/nuclease subunit A